jgi:hypothetical protein
MLPLLACLLVPGFTPAPAAASGPTTTNTAPASPSTSDPPACQRLAEQDWPATVSARQALLAQMQGAREACIGHAPFLALLGALWLEAGDANQALLWLERALLLQPDLPGALADHALALAALGDRTALTELLERWRQRSDVPAALRQRLEAAGQPGLQRPVPRGSDGSSPSAWNWVRGVSLLHGHESNLDHSPRLTEITLSSPDGPIELPLAVPFEPRAGRAWASEASLQGQRRTSESSLWQVGAQLSARHAPAEPGTDQRQAQLALAHWQRDGSERRLLQVSWVGVSGPLADPYQAITVSAAWLREWNGCTTRWGGDAEWRLQRVNAVADAQTASAQAGLLCRLGHGGATADGQARPESWALGGSVRFSVDSPRDPNRPGGSQNQFTLSLRAQGPAVFGTRLEIGLRQTWLRDREGYSPLLDSNARRTQEQQQVSLEISRRLPSTWLGGLTGAELVFQFQGLQQRSNLPLFRHRGASSFAGLRWEG